MEAFSIVEHMRMGTNSRFPIKLRSKKTILLRPLSIYEQNKVVTDSMEEQQSKPSLQQHSMMENTVLMLKTLELASTSDYGKTDFVLSTSEMQKLSAQELQYLWAEYVSACDKLNPRLEKMSKEDMQDLISECKKKEESWESALMNLSFWELWNMALHQSSTPSE